MKNLQAHADGGLWSPSRKPATDWADPATGFTAGLRVEAGVAILTVCGPLGSGTAGVMIPAMQTALRTRAPSLVLDLSGADVGDESVTMLRTLGRLTSRHGVTTWLCGMRLSTSVRLAQVIAGGALRVAPNVELAVAAARRR